jgi:hypothetical protein
MILTKSSFKILQAEASRIYPKASARKPEKT